jgi:DGC domain.
MSPNRRVVIVPCSGIGKTFGTVSREAAYTVVEDLRPDKMKLVALSLLVMGEEEARAAEEGHPTVTIDGFSLA